MPRGHENAEFSAGRPARTHAALRMAAGWAVFAVYLAGVQAWIGWGALLAPWQSLQAGQLVVAAGLFVLSYAVRAHRFHDYLRDATAGRWLSVLRLTLIHNALNNLMPMRSGEVSFPLLAKRYFGLGYVRSGSALLWFRLLDLHTVALIGGAALIDRAWGWAAALMFVMPCLAVPPLVLAARRRLRCWLQARTAAKSAGIAMTVLDGLPTNWPALLRSWALTWVNWLLKILVLAWVLMQFVDVGRAGAVAGAVGGELTSVLPFHAPAGVGTYEAGIVAGLTPFGADVRPAVEAAVNAHLFLLAASLACAGTAMLFPAPVARETTV